MYFSKLFSVAALAASVHAQLSSDQVVSNINGITDLSSQTNDLARSISFSNVFTTGPQLIDNFQQIISLASEDVTAMGSPSRKARRQSAPPYDESNQLAICDAFRDFVGVHQMLLATVIGKHGLLEQTPFTQPLAQVLRVLEGGVDTLAFSVIDDVPTCADESTQQKNNLDQSLQDAVETYDS